jgi:hypothetical protein
MKQDNRFSLFISEKIKILEHLFERTVTNMCISTHSKFNLVPGIFFGMSLDGELINIPSIMLDDGMIKKNDADKISELFFEKAKDIVLFGFVTHLDELKKTGKILKSRNHIYFCFISCVNGLKEIIYQINEPDNKIKELYNIVTSKKNEFTKTYEVGWDIKNKKTIDNSNSQFLADIASKYTQKLGAFLGVKNGN